MNEFTMPTKNAEHDISTNKRSPVNTQPAMISAPTDMCTQQVNDAVIIKAHMHSAHCLKQFLKTIFFSFY